MILLNMGYLEEATSELDCALLVAQEQGNLETQGWTHGSLCLAGTFHRGDRDGALSCDPGI